MSKKLSILSEINPIDCWLNTPVNYYVCRPTFGNNLHILLFKNTRDIKSKLNEIVDKIEEDLGYEIARTIRNIELVATKELDEYYIVIYHSFGSSVVQVEV